MNKNIKDLQDHKADIQKEFRKGQHEIEWFGQHKRHFLTLRGRRPEVHFLILKSAYTNKPRIMYQYQKRRAKGLRWKRHRTLSKDRSFCEVWYLNVLAEIRAGITSWEEIFIRPHVCSHCGNPICKVTMSHGICDPCLKRSVAESYKEEVLRDNPVEYL